MGHANRLEEEDDGYEGCSEGESDVDLTSHPQVQLLWCTLYSVVLQLPLLWFHYVHYQAGKHTRKKDSATRTDGRGVEGSSKVPNLTDMISSEVKCYCCCQF